MDAPTLFTVADCECDDATSVEIEIVYALPIRQHVAKIAVPAGTTLEQAICLSGILNIFPEIDLKRNRVGVFNKLVKLDTSVQPYDRVEIYRSLLIDPKEARRLRVSRSKACR